MTSSPRCVLFDLDGTLIDTAPDLGGAANDLRAELGLPPLSLDVYRPDASHGARGMLALSLGLTPDDNDFLVRRERYITLYRERLSRETRPFPGIDALLDTLDAQGVPWGIVTNKHSALAMPLLEDLGLRARSRSIVCGDTAARPKPAPDPLLLACRELDVEAADCVYVGDDHRDIVAGQAAQMRTAVALWGYLGRDATPDDWQADSQLAQPADVLGLLRNREPARP